MSTNPLYENDIGVLNVTVLYTVYVYHTECDGSTQGHQDMSNYQLYTAQVFFTSYNRAGPIRTYRSLEGAT